MTWALKRQISYISILVLFFAIFGFLLIYPSLNKAPTCMDGLQNGTETGVDCGGSCSLACTFEAENATVIWARSFDVVPGRYNAVAYIENHNKNLAADKVKYSFRFADKNNVYLGRREGVAYIPPGQAFAIFERGIELGSSAPVYTTFEFTQAPVWIKVPDSALSQVRIMVSEVTLEGEDSAPHLSAVIKNDSLLLVPSLSVAVILYDEEENAITSSSTIIDELGPEASKTIDFTWPASFAKKVVTKEILPVYNIFSVKVE